MLKMPETKSEMTQIAPPLQAVHKHYKWELLALLSCAFFFHQADRAIYGVVLTSIKNELHLADEQLGLVASALFLTLALMTPIAGYLGDILNRKWIITISLFFWSTTTMLTGMVSGLISLITFRSVATAGGESFYAPAAYSLMASLHKKTRALALSVHQGAYYIGVIASGFLGGMIADHWGWRTTFYIFGGCGIVLGLLFMVRLKEVPRESEAAGQPATPKIGVKEAASVLFRTPTAMLNTLGFMALVFVNNAYLVWAPNFIQEKFHLTLTQAGTPSMFYHYIAALAGVLIGGQISDMMVPKRPQFRLQLQAVSLLIAAPVLAMMGLASTLAGTCMAMAGMGFFRGLCEANTQATLFDVIPPRFRASALSVMIMCAFLIGSTSPRLLGSCRTHWGQQNGLSYGFAALSLVFLAGGLAFLCAWLFTFRRDRYIEGAES